MVGRRKTFPSPVQPVAVEASSLIRGRLSTQRLEDGDDDDGLGDNDEDGDGCVDDDDDGDNANEDAAH